jgi:hypothetical protein
LTRFVQRNQDSRNTLTALKKYIFHALLTLGFWPMGGYAWASDQGLSFDRDIRPILSDNCFHCHGPDAKKRKAKLRLDTKEGILADLGGYAPVKPGDPAKSELFARISSHDPEERMPPPDSNRNLSPKEIALLKEWIAGGAKWTGHWTFEPIVRPDVKDKKIHPIDFLVEKRLKAEKFKPTPRAERKTLIRRLSLDLTGLPPTLEQIDAFLADDKPGAWERLVDRTLDSPAYGERMAWDWLAAARYADTNGYQGDRERTMWPWRDWVVKAFNQNLPYDEFSIWQLAGDLLPDPTQEQILATGFNRNHMINGEGGRIAEENRVEYVFDMTETMGTLWMGLTLNCARCHDHKFDPLTQREYYELNAFFNQTPVNGGGGDPFSKPVLQAGSSAQNEELIRLQKQIAVLQKQIEQRQKSQAEAQAKWETHMLKDLPKDDWKRLLPKEAKAKAQTLEISESGLIYAKGANPDTDEYQVVYPLGKEKITGFKLEAVRHPKMTKGGLARSDSGNFVLTDIRFKLRNSAVDELVPHQGQSAQATYEQGPLKIASALDDNPGTGWAVWSGKPIARDHAASFRLKEAIEPAKGAELEITLKFNSKHKNHNLGHFRFSSTTTATPTLKSNRGSLIAALQTAPDKRSPSDKKTVLEAFAARDDSLSAFGKKITSLEAKVKKTKASFPKVMVMAEMAKPRQTFMLDRGLYNQRGDKVEPAFPSWLPTRPGDGRPNRLDLAKWLMDPKHPLTARVTVNRFWQMLFGVGLVKTTENFGIQTEFPRHPELLDWLAAEFIESGWDLKGLLRTIVTSETYRRSSKISSFAEYERDPENRFLARGTRFRMPSWMIRDQALASSGLLNPAMGGKSVYSYQPDGIWAEATFGKKRFKQDTGDALYRRSLYTYWRRIIGPTLFFDVAKRQVCEVKPLRTNTPMHALTLLNDVTYVEAGRALADLVLKEAGEEEPRMRLAVRKVLGREPAPKELEVFKQSLQRALDSFGKDPESAKRFLSHGDSKSESKVEPVTRAAWAALCLNLFNLDETLNKE